MRGGTLPGSTEQPLLPAPMSVLYLTDHDCQGVSSPTACSDAGGAVGFARRGPRSARRHVVRLRDLQRAGALAPGGRPGGRGTVVLVPRRPDPGSATRADRRVPTVGGSRAPSLGAVRGPAGAAHLSRPARPAPATSGERR